VPVGRWLTQGAPSSGGSLKNQCFGPTAIRRPRRCSAQMESDVFTDQLNREVTRAVRSVALLGIPSVVLLCGWFWAALPHALLIAVGALVTCGSLSVFTTASLFLRSGRIVWLRSSWVAVATVSSGWGLFGLIGIAQHSTSEVTVSRILFTLVAVLSTSIATNAASKVGVTLFVVPLSLLTAIGLYLRGGQIELLLLLVVYLACLAQAFRTTNNVTRNAMSERNRADALALQLGEALRETEQDSLHDPLTGAGNRRLLARRYADTPIGLISVMCLDLDRFKLLNDTHGHAIGDELLVAVTTRLQGLIRAHDQLIRLGGDEFMVVSTVDPSQFLGVAKRVLSGLTERYELSVGDVSVGVSIGLANGRPAESLELTERRADNALYQAKAAGRGRIVVHEEQTASASVASLALTRR
jgi:diguanylate cyclase (GGDEF)-like protein